MSLRQAPKKTHTAGKKRAEMVAAHKTGISQQTETGREVRRVRSDFVRLFSAVETLF